MRISNLANFRLVTGLGLLAAAPLVPVLLPHGATMVVGTVVPAAVGIGINFLHQWIDLLGERFTRSRHPDTSPLLNEDLARLVGRTLAKKLQERSQNEIVSPDDSAVLARLAAHAEQGWLNIAKSPELANGIGTQQITGIFAMRSEEFEKATTLNDSLWIHVLDYLQTLSGKGSLTTSGKSRIAAALTHEFPKYLFMSAKDAFENDREAYAAIELSLMRELMTDVRDVLATVVGMSERVDGLTTKVTALAKLLSEQMNRVAPILYKELPDELKTSMAGIRDSILDGHQEIVGLLHDIRNRLDAMRDDMSGIKKQLAEGFGREPAIRCPRCGCELKVHSRAENGFVLECKHCSASGMSKWNGSKITSFVFPGVVTLLGAVAIAEYLREHDHGGIFESLGDLADYLLDIVA